MPTTTLRPGAVTLGGAPAGMDVHTQSAVVGSPPQWADGSDATYARVNNRTHDSGLWSGTDYAIAPLEVFAPAGTVTAVTVTARASSTHASTVFFRTTLYSTANGPEGVPFASLEELSVAPGGSIQTATGAFLDDDDDPEFNSLANAAVALADGATLAIRTNFPFGANLTVYEVTVTVTTTAEVVRVTRQFPRDDAYGLGSAPRIFPPPRGGRLVGGYM